jgi:hypothetical protein
VDLAKIAVKLRPRNPWEAIDLGFMLARQWFLPLWILWMISAIPMMVLLSVLPIPLWLMGVLLWWFKPLYEPLLLYWLGRRLFHERPSWRELRQQWRRVVLPQLFANLTWRRLAPARSFTMPVAILEGLKGKPRAQRINVLSRKSHAASWLTIVGIHFEFVFEFGFIFLLAMLVPEELLWTDLQGYLFDPDVLGEWVQQITTLVSMSMIAPFYVAGGFALYLNRRSELEAWDLELGLRHMAQRHRQRHPGSALAGLILCVMAVLSLPCEPLQAAEEVDRQAVRTTIDEVLAQEDFGQLVEKTRWVPIDKPIEETNNLFIEWLKAVLKSFANGIASIGELLLWLVGGALLAYLIYWFIQNRGLLRDGSLRRARQGRSLPTHIAGLDLRPESLPEDPAAMAERLINEGQYRSALSLLYRGALSFLVHHHALEIPSGATEGECQRLAQQQLETALHECFSGLTGVWLLLAYDHRPPEKQQALSLCQQWRGCFGEGHAE